MTDAAAQRKQEAGSHLQQRALAAAAGSHYGGEPGGLDGEADAVQDAQRPAVDGIGELLLDVLKLNGRLRAVPAMRIGLLYSTCLVPSLL